MSGKTVCPRCQAENLCSAASESVSTQHCWCFDFGFSPALKAKIEKEYPEKDRCLCRACIETLATEVDIVRQT